MLGGELLRLTAETLSLVLLTSGPVLIASLVVGLGMGLLQAVTQVQEQSLSFVPKLLVVAGVLALTAGWMTGQLVEYTRGLWTAIPTLVP